jgi:predicted metal-dependent phosphoesterase TrpH
VTSGWIDLHSHTTASDGTFTPRELVSLATEIGLAALAITDHDTFAGYEQAVPFAREAQLDLIRGIELISKSSHPHVHLLAYFPSHASSDPLRGTTPEDLIRSIRAAGGIPVVAHPGRLSLPRDLERQLLITLKHAGLLGLEVYHSEHPAHLQAYYLAIAQELDLLPTGGSDFHGAAKPTVRLGTGIDGNVRVPVEFLHRLKNQGLT